MAYIINKYNNTVVTSVEDGTINTTLDIKLIGKNYAGYGEVQNENFVWMLENFASNIAPPNALVGQLWFDNSVQKLKVNYAKDKWHTLGVTDVIAADQSPEGLSVGDMWWKVDTDQLYCKGIAGDVLIGGRAPAVITQMRSKTVTDIHENPHQIIEGVVDGKTVFIVSYDAEFTIKQSDEINGFVGYLIRPGLTMRDTKNDLTSDSGFRFWGTISNSEKLGGIDANQYVDKIQPQFPNAANFSGSGLTIGLSPNEQLRIYNDVTSTPVIRNVKDSTIKFQTTVIENSVEVTKEPMHLVGQNIMPGNPGHSNIGGDTPDRFNTVYAETFDGNATTASVATLANTVKALQADRTTYLPANAAIGDRNFLSELAGTVAVRTNVQFQYGTDTITVGSLISDFFVGKAVHVVGGDLAEKYLPDDTYEIGTVLMIGGEKEVTAAQSGCRAIGAVSVKPAYIMNQELEGGINVALKGRVPVKVLGKVKKGDRLIASDNGTAQAITTECGSLVFAVALSDSDNMDVSVVEALIL